MATYVERLCLCGGIGCGGKIRVRNRNRQFPGRLKVKLCSSCTARGCRGHYDEGTNIPARSCPARQEYDRKKVVR